MTQTREKGETRKLPMMPIRDMVIFPYMMTPFVVGRESSVRALEEALSGDRKIFLATQHDASIDEPKAKDIFQVGSICNIVQSVKMPDGNIKVLVEGVERAKSTEVTDRDGFFVATVRVGKSQFEMTAAAEQLMQRVTGLFEQYVKLQQSLNYETIIATVRMDEPAKLSDTIAANLQLGIEEKQELLAIFDPAARLARIADVLDVEIEKLDLDRNIQSRVKRQMERAQKEYYLNEKIKAIQKELGRGEKSEFDELRKKIEASGMPKDVLEKAVQELKKLEAMPPMSAESTVSRNYIDWLLAVPWKKKSTPTTTAWKKSRSASSSFWPCASSSKIPKGPSSALPDLRAWAKPRWACPSPRPQAASSCASRWAACATKPKSAAIAALTLARSPARSSST
jgi:ATP-dependent Lon protease